MPYEEVYEPVRGPAAFEQTEGSAVLSQAAILFALAYQLRGVTIERLLDLVPGFRDFPVPHLRPRQGDVDPGKARDFLRGRYGDAIRRRIRARETLPPGSEILADLARVVFQEKETALAATALIDLCLRHPDELVRVTAAACYAQLGAFRPELLPWLREGASSEEELVREIAANELARVAPDDPRLLELMEKSPGAEGVEPSHTSLLVHGTWARGGAWWQPGGIFHSYLQHVRPGLYAAADRFDWSGGYSDLARALGALELCGWVGTRGLNGLDLFAHSHGGSVAMLGGRGGLDIGELVLLSCPVHVPKYEPDFRRVKKVVSIRVHLDLVILADGGGQRFRDPRIDEHVLPVWFRHSATRDPVIWQNFNVPSMLQSPSGIESV